MVLASLKSHSISSMFHRTLLDPQLSSALLYTDSYTCTWFVYLSFVVKFFDVSIHCHSASRVLLWPTGLNNPVTQVMSPNLSSKSAANTPINVPSRKGSLDTNLDDLATAVDASEIHDTTDVGRLTSPLFSQERELSAIPFSVSCSQTHSIVEKSSRDVEPFSSFGKPLSKG